MREMQEKCVVHRDIKNANIFIKIPEKNFRKYFDPIFDQVQPEDLVSVV